MTGFEFQLAILLGALVLVWVGVTMFTAATRAIFDVRRAVLRVATRVLQRRIRRGLKAGSVDRLLRLIPLRTLARFAADATVDPVASTAAARFVVARQRATLVAEAADTGHGERQRWRRVAALWILARAEDPEAVSLLEPAALAADATVTPAAIAALGSVRSEAAAAVLVAALRGGSYARSRIAAQLETFPLRVPHLIGPLLADHDPAVRYWGTKLAAVHTGAASPEELAELAAELDAQIRAAAAEALGTSAADRDTLVRLLHDAVPFVRAHAARALGATGAAGAAGEIAPLLGDPDWWVRAAAKEGLQRVGPAAATVLVPLLDDSDRFVRNGAAEVLQRVGTLDELLTSFGDEDGADAQLLRKLFQAGEHRYALLALERAPEERRQLLRELVPAT